MKKINKGTVVIIRHIIGELVDVEGVITRLENGKYRFQCDAYVDGETCKGGFFHLRQARRVIPGKRLGNNVKRWPRLRKALQVSGVQSVNVPGGAEPIHYEDEIVVKDFSMSGAHYFIVKKSDIGKYLETLPLDDVGKRRAEEHARKEAEAAAEAYRQEHDPQCIAKRIGNKLWYGNAMCFGGEFKKITLVAEDATEFSVIYPEYSTNLIWGGYENVPRILCEAPETGVEYLAGEKAACLDPRKHNRIKRVKLEFFDDRAYLMPNPDLANVVMDSRRWLGMFDNSNNDGIDPQLIASAKKVILEAYDLNDKLQRERFVYDSDSREVTKEILHNWPFSAFGKKLADEDFDWRPEQVEA